MTEPERGAETSDETLILAVGQGDVRAFRALVERHRSRIMRLAFGVVRDRAEAEDIVQESFERIWTKASDYRPREGGRFTAWLARITLNLAIDRARRPRQTPLDAVPDPPSKALGSDDRLLGKEIGRRIAKSLAALPERQRLAFALCQIDGLSNQAAASHLEISLGAVELLLVRARRALRHDLADLMDART